MIFKLGHDDEFVGVTPGLLPTGPAQVRRMRTREYEGPIAPAFVPPADVRPAVAGTVIDKKANPQDLAAMLVDLSLRGWFEIRPAAAMTDVVEPGAGDGKAPAGGRGGDSPGRADDWFFVRPEQPCTGDISVAEAVLRDAVLGDDAVRPLSVAKDQLAKRGRRIVAELCDEVERDGYFHANPGRWRPFGARRTATGNAVRVQAMGFKRYLETAEAEQIKVEEAEQIFNRYLPWAMAFGVTSQWSKLVAGVMARQQAKDVLAGGAAMVLDPDVWWLAAILSDAGDIADLASVIGDGASGLVSWAGGLGDGGLAGFGDALGGLGDIDLLGGMGELLGGAGDVMGSGGELLGDLFSGIADLFDGLD